MRNHDKLPYTRWEKNKLIGTKYLNQLIVYRRVNHAGCAADFTIFSNYNNHLISYFINGESSVCKMVKEIFKRCLLK